MEVLARWLPRRAGWVVVVTLVLLAVCGLYSAHLPDRLSGGGWSVPGSEEARAVAAQDAGFLGRGSSSVTLLVHDDRFSAPSAEFDLRVADVVARSRPIRGCGSAASWAGLRCRHRSVTSSSARTAAPP